MKRALAFLLIVLLAAVTFWTWWQNDPSDRPATPEWSPNPSGTSPTGRSAAYLRGAHWFGEGWAINFWNTRLLARAAEDFAALSEDGFNTVVLVIPWPGFSATPTEGQLDPERAERLAALIDLAADAELNVVLRIGFTWDSRVAHSDRWQLQLWLDEDVRQGWLRHIAALWNVVKDQPHVRFAFISWENLWAIEGAGSENYDQRLTMARDTGYRDWLQRFSTLNEVSDRYGVRFRNWQEVPVPRRDEPAFGLFFDFIDHAWIERFFKPARSVFPTMSMEIRIDSDPSWNAPGELAYWHSHELAWDLPGAGWTTVYWAPAMGGENRGETISPKIAAERLAYLMRRVRQVTGDRPIFIDRFLVEDFTPGFEMNGRLARDNVDEFLEAAHSVLASVTHGYALWAWRDYAHNAVASPDFFTLQGNWEDASPDGDEAPSYTLRTGERLQRSFEIHEFHTPGGPAVAELCVEAVTDGDPSPDLLVISDGLTDRADLDVTGNGRDCVDIDVKPLTTVILEASSDLELFTVSFSGFTQTTGIRDINGQPKAIAPAWRALNRALTLAQPEALPLFDDGWMGKTLHKALFAPRGDAPLQLRFTTQLPANWPFQPRLSVQLNNTEIGTVPCGNNADHVLHVDRAQTVSGRQQVTLTVDRTYRPDGDERRLGCLVDAVVLEKAD